MATATQQPGQTDADSDEQYNAARTLSEKEFDFSSQINDKYRHAGDDDSARGSSDVADATGVGGFLKNYNADDPDLKDQEGNPDPIPGSHERQGFWGKLRNASRKKSATAVISALLGVFGLGTATISPLALLPINFSDIVSNHTSLGDHLLAKTGNSYVAAFLKGNNRNCVTSKIKCKFTTISEKRLKEWDARGIKVTADTTRIPGINGDRYKVRSLEYKNTKVTTINQYKSLKATNPNFNSLLKRYPIRAWLLEKGPFRKGTLEKFGKNIADKFASSKNKDKNQRTEENNKAMNSKTGAPVDENGKVTPEKVKSSASEKTGKAVSASSEKFKSAKTGLKVVGGAIGGASAATVMACMAYDVVRATQAGILAYWHEQLISFALPFLQAGAQAKEAGVNGGFDWETAEYAGDRLMQPITQKDIDANPDDDITQDMLGKTAMDAKGMDAALSGSFASLTGEQNYASKYTGWMPAGMVWGSGIVQKIQESFGGKQNIRDACLAAKYVAYVGLAGCVTDPIRAITCIATIGIQQAVTQIWGKDILEAITNELEEPAMNAIADANLSSSLHGPPLGQALVSGAGVMTSYMDNASGFAYAGDDSQALQAYNDMYTDEDYLKGEIADGRQKAEGNQFDTSNKYSFAGQLVSKFANVPMDGTLFSVFANMVGATANSPALFANASAMQQGIYQPIGIYQTDKNLQGTLKNCTSPGVKEINKPCLGESGRAVPQIMPNVQKCLDEELQDNNDTLCIEKAIDYLSAAKYKDKDNNEKTYIDLDSGRPNDWGDYKENSEEDYKNPILMFMQYCGRDRVYPLGYTDKSIEDDTDDWHTGAECFASSSTQTTEVCQNGSCNAGSSSSGDRDTTLGWMSYYYSMCIGMFASEEDQNYCWDDAAVAAPTGGDWILPTGGTCGDGFDPTGARIHRTHKGVDLSSPAGTPILAPTDLKILFVGQSPDGSTGNMVAAQAADGSNGFMFMHMQEQSPLTAGQTVAKGTQIGKVGSTGDSSGPHLHMDVFPPGVSPLSYAGQTDPVAAFAAHKTQIVGCR